MLQVLSGLGFCQTNSYLVYTDKQNGFSFQIPQNWRIGKLTGDEAIVGECKPVHPSEKALYEACYDGIVFYVELRHSPLD